MLPKCNILPKPNIRIQTKTRPVKLSRNVSVTPIHFVKVGIIATTVKSQNTAHAESPIRSRPNRASQYVQDGNLTSSLICDGESWLAYDASCGQSSDVLYLSSLFPFCLLLQDQNVPKLSVSVRIAKHSGSGKCGFHQYRNYPIIL